MIETAARQSDRDKVRKGVIESSAALASLAEDVVQKIGEFGVQLPAGESEEMKAYCKELLTGRIEELKQGEKLEEIRQLNRDLQERALGLFRKATRKVSLFVFSANFAPG